MTTWEECSLHTQSVRTFSTVSQTGPELFPKSCQGWVQHRGPEGWWLTLLTCKSVGVNLHHQLDWTKKCLRHDWGTSLDESMNVIPRIDWGGSGVIPVGVILWLKIKGRRREQDECQWLPQPCLPCYDRSQPQPMRQKKSLLPVTSHQILGDEQNDERMASGDAARTPTCWAPHRPFVPWGLGVASYLLLVFVLS